MLPLTCLSLLFLCSSQKKQVSQTKIRVISTILFILAGCIVFVTIPAVIFKYIEGWTALESIYFVVVTLTTVGFGDFVAGKQATWGSPVTWALVGKTIFWMSFPKPCQGLEFSSVLMCLASNPKALALGPEP